MAQPDPINIAVAAATTARQHDAALLAKQLQLPLSDLSQNGYQFLLVFTEERLELRQTGKQVPGPLYVDFVGGAVDYRRRHGGGRKQAIARAVGIKSGYLPTIFDVTAGLGRDAFVLAGLGCRVHLYERSPIINALLEDGIKRAESSNEIGAIVRERMLLTFGDSRVLLLHLQDEKPDVVYLDPMYPHRTKSVLVKKEMRYLRALVGDDQDAPELLAKALQYAQKRVVVKRPKSAPSIEGTEPNLIIKTKNSRFDVYLR